MTDHYFSEQPGATSENRRVRFTVAGREYDLASSTGVFSGDRLDPGTSVLLRETPLPAAAGTFLDLGCGYGPIACVLATRVPGATVWGVDVNTRALELCQVNARTSGVGDRVETAVPGDVPTDVTFDQIWSNPPIRIGKVALHELLRRWLSRLADGGVARLVVARSLGADSLQRWLVDSGWPTERYASSKGFRLLAVRK